MVELCFNQSAQGALKMAQHCGGKGRHSVGTVFCTSELLFPRGTAYLSSRSCSARTFRICALTARREGFSPSSDVQNTVPTLWRPLPPQC